MATHSSILAWEIPRREEPGGPWDRKESDRTEHMHVHPSAALNMPANLENSAVATGLENVSFGSNPKEGQRQRIFRLPNNCVHFSC